MARGGQRYPMRDQMDLLRTRALVLGLLGLSGCAPTLAMADQHARIAPNRMVALPVIVTEFELDAETKMTRKASWEGEAQENLNAAIEHRMASNGGRVVSDVLPPESSLLEGALGPPTGAAQATYNEFREVVSRCSARDSTDPVTKDPA